MEKVHHIAIIKTIHIYSQIHRHTHLDIQYTMCKCISCVNLFSNFSNWKFSNSVMSCVHLAHSFMSFIYLFDVSVLCICLRVLNSFIFCLLLLPVISTACVTVYSLVFATSHSRTIYVLNPYIHSPRAFRPLYML